MKGVIKNIVPIDISPLLEGEGGIVSNAARGLQQAGMPAMDNYLFEFFDHKVTFKDTLKLMQAVYENYKGEDNALDVAVESINTFTDYGDLAENIKEAYEYAEEYVPPEIQAYENRL